MKLIHDIHIVQSPVWQFIPFVQCWYTKEFPLETGVNTQMWAFTLGWLKWSITYYIQEIY